MSTMTRKEWLQELLTRNRDGRFPAVNGNACSYRTPDGKTCAAGILIPDEDYHPDMEGIAVRALLARHEFALPEWADSELIAAAQRVHDDTAAPIGPAGARMATEWSAELFLARLRADPRLSRAFEEEGLVIA